MLKTILAAGAVAAAAYATPASAARFWIIEGGGEAVRTVNQCTQACTVFSNTSGNVAFGFLLVMRESDNPTSYADANGFFQTSRFGTPGQNYEEYSIGGTVNPNGNSSGSYNFQISARTYNETIRTIRLGFTQYAVEADSLETGLTIMNMRAVPEPGTWAMMIAGFGLTGAAVRRRRQAQVAA